MDTKTLKYVPQEHVREKNTFIEEFYSSPDVTIYIDDAEFTEASYVEFNVQEQLKPLYGYNSEVFDDVAIGNRIVLGSVTVPIKNVTENELIDENTPSIYEDTEDLISGNTVPGWVKNYEGGKSSLHVESDGNTLSNFLNPIFKNPQASLNESYILQYSEEIKKAQQVLYSLEYDVYINGYLDIKTRSALSKYQELNGLTVTGNLSEETKIFMLGGDLATIIDYCNLYIAPDTTKGVISILKTGTKVDIITEYGLFMYVRVKTTETIGYVEKSCLKMVQ